MNRNIKFKAKTLDNSEWVEGDLLHKNNGIYIYCPHINKRGYLIQNVRVDPSTVCQFTGLKDKNGKEVWEHDIVKYMSECEVVFGKVGICLKAASGHVIFISSTGIEGDKLVLWSNLGSKFDRKEEK